jgi:regulator of sirC expression with transglutaminase-like and TPR domain
MTDMILHLGLLGDEEIELDVAALALSALDHEGIDIAPQLAILTAIGLRLAEIGDGVDDGRAQAALLAQVFHDEFGFAGDRDSYDAPLNADMIRVIDRRRGLPVSLSILYVAAARRIGWFADALNTPGHVIVSVGPDTSRTLIDPFNGGTPVAPEQMMALLSQAQSPGAWPAEAHIEAMSNRTTLVRLLLNQATRAEQAGDTVRAEALYERMTIIAPSYGQGWWDLARLQLVGRQVDAARASLSAMLEITREPDRRAQIADALERLAGR